MLYSIMQQLGVVAVEAVMEVAVRGVTEEEMGLLATDTATSTWLLDQCFYFTTLLSATVNDE